MRPAAWPPRHVKLQRLALASRPPATFSRSLSTSLTPRVALRRHDVKLKPPASFLAATCRNHSTALIGDFDYTVSAQTTSLAPAAGPATNPEPRVVLTAESYGQWQSLLHDSRQLAIETDFKRKGKAKGYKGILLAHKAVHRGDFALWCCFLDYQARVKGDEGIRDVWRGFWGSKSLYTVDGPLALTFWNTILDAALRLGDPAFLHDVWLYAEWMLEAHNIRWPSLYSKIVEYFLRKARYQDVVQWHLRLAPTYCPNQDEFASTLKRFSTSSFENRQGAFDSLKTIYTLSRHRQLYDHFIPYLYDKGDLPLARKWRDIFIHHGDVPLDPIPVRPFVRYLQGYCTKTALHQRELEILSSDAAVDSNAEISREFMNRLHGNTLGISVKTYNDQLGARWFASSWVSLDTAIATVATFGVQQIGPLSFQSMALRGGSCGEVAKHIQRLSDWDISIADSNYVRLLMHLVRLGDDRLLFDLLLSDMHPDVFEDLKLQEELLDSAAKFNDLRSYRLLLVAKIVILQKTARQAANELVRSYFLYDNRQGLLLLLDDMRAMGISLDYDVTDLIFSRLLRKVSMNVFLEDSIEVTKYYHAICKRLMAMEIPVPMACWRRLLESFGRQGHMHELEVICFDLVEWFTTLRSRRPGFVPVHIDDVPSPIKKPYTGISKLIGMYIPQDVPGGVVNAHPLCVLFTAKMTRDIIRWYFHASQNQINHVPLLGQPPGEGAQNSGLGRSVRLFRALRQRGFPVHQSTLAKGITTRLVQLYGQGVETKRHNQIIRARNTLTLAQMKAQLDSVWGRISRRQPEKRDGPGGRARDRPRHNTLLPSLRELYDVVRRKGEKRARRHAKYLRSRGQRAPRLRPRLTEEQQQRRARPRFRARIVPSLSPGLSKPSSSSLGG